MFDIQKLCNNANINSTQPDKSYTDKNKQPVY